MEYIFIVLIVIYMIIAWILYHKIFDVVYFDIQQGCLGELIGCTIVAVILAYLTLHYWAISALIAFVACLIAFCCSKTSEGRGVVVIVGIILILFIVIVGILFNKWETNKREEKNATGMIYQECISDKMVG